MKYICTYSISIFQMKISKLQNQNGLRESIKIVWCGPHFKDENVSLDEIFFRDPLTRFKHIILWVDNK